MFQYMWNIRGGAAPQMTFGNVMHTTIKEFVGEDAQRRQKCRSRMLLAIYDREWSSAGFPDDYHEQEYRKAGREQLEAFHRSVLALRPPTCCTRRKRFELPLRARRGDHRPHGPDEPAERRRSGNRRLQNRKAAGRKKSGG